MLLKTAGFKTSCAPAHAATRRRVPRESPNVANRRTTNHLYFSPRCRSHVPHGNSPPRALYSKGTLRSSPYLHPPPFSLSPSPVPEGWVPQGRGRARPAPFGRLGDWDSPPQTPLFGHFLAAKKVTRARRRGPAENCMKRTPSGVLFSCLCIFPHMPAVLPPGGVSPA